MSELLKHICEVCGLEENLTPEQAFEDGWDYPPGMGVFGVISPRTCPNCPINRTVWWAITLEGRTKLDARQMAIVERILAEPESIRLGATT